MITEGIDYIGKKTVKTQVCIVGSGQAGITLAWYLLGKGIDVTILEGSRVFSPEGANEQVTDAYSYNENSKLYNGESTGLFASNEAEFLIRPTKGVSDSNGGWERERIYGGTSTHWGGQSRPLDPTTFMKRPGFVGWPITREDLDPYYSEASKFLDLYGDYYAPDGTAGYNFTAEFWANELGLSVADMEGFDVDMYQFVPSDNLQFQARKVNGQTIGESKANVILNASLLKINEANKTVTELTVGVMGGTKDDPTKAGEFTVQADCYVLACGAVANARQLLLSDIGNENDLVGRYLSGQPIAQNTQAVFTNNNYMTNSEKKLITFMSLPTDSDGNNKYSIDYIKGVLTPNADSIMNNPIGSCWFSSDGTSNFYHGLLPEYESRITLSDNLDPVFAQKQSKAVWVLSPQEEDSFNILADLFKKAVQAKAGVDHKVTIYPWSNIKDNMVYNGHHLCTTRMSAKATDGVVDMNLKVHSMDNLYCAGSSVWSTPGVSNPTFSIVAFSIRLATHLIKQLSAPGGTES
ncbi:MAG: choline dehydrogenase-like flavoprotein [Crocinitomix sp.]|jgi:choline dehydrogenase-like flavoprotein